MLSEKAKGFKIFEIFDMIGASKNLGDLESYGLSPRNRLPRDLFISLERSA